MVAQGPLDGAIFDMDGTLLDTERLLLEAMDATALAAGQGHLRPEFRAVNGLRADLAAAHLSERFGGRAAYDAFAEDVEMRRAALETHGIPLKPFAREALAHISGLGVPVAVATSTQTAIAEDLLERTELRGYLGAVIGGDLVDRPKPDPEIYRLAATSLGLAPTRCAAFEDSAPGTRAAVAAGCVTVQIPDIAQPDADLRALGHLVCQDLREAARGVGFPF